MDWHKLRLLYKLPTLLALAIVGYLQWNMLASANQAVFDLKQQYTFDDGDVPTTDAGDPEVGLIAHVSSMIDVSPDCDITTQHFAKNIYKKVATQSRAPPKSD
jgi:hypothetical protein